MTVQLSPYPSYRESGVPWLERLPEHWRVRRLKTLFHEVDERSIDGGETLLSLRMSQGLIGHLASGGKYIEPEALVGYKRTQPGQLVMNRMRAASGLFAVTPVPGIVSPDYAVFSIMGDAVPEYYVQLFKTPLMMGVFRTESRGLGDGESGFLRLYTDRFGMTAAPHPPIDDQHAIVRFLVHLDSRITRLIRAKRRLIDLLNEQKQAIIHRAVTHGLDPSVRLKPSGIEWLGNVPEHWDIVPVKRILRRMIDCEHKTAPAVDESNFRVVRTTAVRNGNLRLEGTYCTTAEGYAEWTRRGAPEAGDIIFTREAPAGEACIVPTDYHLSLGQRTVLLKLKREQYSPQFLVHMVYSGPPMHRIRIASQGSTVGHFNVDDIAAMPVLRPTLGEQVAIVEHIENETSSVTKAIRQCELETTLVREYRNRLVSDVVTGKLDVRSVQLEAVADRLLEDLDMSDDNAEDLEVEDSTLDSEE